MLNLKCHTPGGVTDYMPEECMAKNDIENAVAKVFEGYSYRRIETPAFEYHDIYSGTFGDVSSEKLFKFFDAEGRILALRGDVTTSIARVMGTKYTGDLPARLYYVADAFRYNGSASSMPSEFTQAGVELIGENSAAADAETIIVTIMGLLKSGLEEFQIDIGQVEFFKGLAEQAELTAEETEKIRVLIDFKDTLTIGDMVSNRGLDNDICRILCDMPTLFGGADILERAYSSKLNDRSKKALKNLKDVYDIICKCGLEKYVSIDLGMLQSIDYYTGVIFKGATYDVGFSLCGGGRYDSLIENFGKPMSAVGVAISVNRVLMALQRQKKALRTPKTDILYCLWSESECGFKTGEALRDAELVVENYLGGCDMSFARKYAQEHDIKIIATPDGDGGAIFNYVDGTQKQITAEEIANGGDLI